MAQIREIRANMERVTREIALKAEEGKDIAGEIDNAVLAYKLYPTHGYSDGGGNIENCVGRLTDYGKKTVNKKTQEQVDALNEFVLLFRSYPYGYNDKHDVRARRCMDNMSLNKLIAENNFIAKIEYRKAVIVHYAGRADKLVIPPEIDGVEVSAIDDAAFCGKGLKEVVFPPSLESIGECAFANNHLVSVDFPERFFYIGAGAFHWNKLQTANMPPTVRYIGNGAFEQNELRQVKIPSGSTWVGSKAFSHNRIENLEIPEGISIIRNEAFYDDHISPDHPGLTSLVIPKTVTDIEPAAFMHHSLMSITLPANINLRGFGGDLEEYYEQNERRGGVYTYNGELWVHDGESAAKRQERELMMRIKNKNKKDGMTMEELLEQGVSPTIAMMMSEEGKKLREKMQKRTPPIPEEAWDKMPANFREYIRSVIKEGSAVVSYKPKTPDDRIAVSPRGRGVYSDHAVITVFYGPLAARRYDAETGQCFMMS